MTSKLLLFLCSLALVLGSAEIFLRFVAPQNTHSERLRRTAPIYLADDVAIKRLRPGFEAGPSDDILGVNKGASFNSLGYRGREIRQQKEDQTRIWVVGDSFTFGPGVRDSETYSAVLETELLNSEGGAVEVINAGVPGRWVDEYYLDLKRRGLALDPDIVLVGVYIRNDLDGKDARGHVWAEVDAEGLPVVVEFPEIRIENGREVRAIRKSRWKLPIIRDSHVAQLLYDAGKVVDQGTRGRSVKNAHHYQDDIGPEAELAIDKVERLLVAMNDLAQARGIRLVVMLFPARDQLYPENYEALVGLDIEKPQRDLAAFLRSRGIDTLDLLPALRAEKDTTQIHFDHDDHWDVGGHAVVARAIAQHLRSEGYLPGGAAAQ